MPLVNIMMMSEDPSCLYVRYFTTINIHFKSYLVRECTDNIITVLRPFMSR